MTMADDEFAEFDTTEAEFDAMLARPVLSVGSQFPWASRRDVNRELRDLWDHLMAQTEATTRSLQEMRDIMATQADIDALTGKLADMKAALTNADAGIQAEIDELKNAHPDLDLSALQAAVDGLSGQVDATSALVPAPDQPPVDGE